MARAPKQAEDRLLVDAIEGVRLPRENPLLFGHGAMEQALLDAYRSGRMHHAWLLAGDRGIGKATLAFRFARFALAHPDARDPALASLGDLAVSADHPVARRIANGSHPNLLHLQRDWDDRGKRFRTELSVDVVRRIVPFLGTTAGEGGWRFVLVDPADDMNRSAANALLKALEEPPPRTIFFLMAETPGRLLPTILSRCRVLRMPSLADGAVERVLRDVDPASLRSGQEHEVALKLAEGSPRRYIELVREDGLALQHLLSETLASGHPRMMLKLADLVGQTGSGLLPRFMDLYSGYLHRRIRGEAEPGASVDPPMLPIVIWAELWEKAARSAAEVDTYNLDVRQFVLDVLETTAEAIRRPVSHGVA
ncbi:DNA polymerase III, delta prime subunit [Faunimonas pinastri]|uniref:DNA polymerase III, delta prime subunit n=1 Tax=Faunimonas pinastri TaxID=1855383 RepID=A0A1H9N7E2_9HYPH|nr:DNA polymerase III subunit delta' [Faunimonas pinastri]SER31343.1 DNA polymerase III, delta prime subunit [Faunimonas pinastri]